MGKEDKDSSPNDFVIEQEAMFQALEGFHQLFFEGGNLEVTRDGEYFSTQPMLRLETEGPIVRFYEELSG